jgi:hypothetical protein
MKPGDQVALDAFLVSRLHYEDASIRAIQERMTSMQIDADALPEFARWHLDTGLLAIFSRRYTRETQSRIAGGMAFDACKQLLADRLADLAVSPYVGLVDEVLRTLEMRAIGSLINNLSSWRAS